MLSALAFLCFRQSLSCLTHPGKEAPLLFRGTLGGYQAPSLRAELLCPTDTFLRGSSPRAWLFREARTGHAARFAVWPHVRAFTFCPPTGTFFPPHCLLGVLSVEPLLSRGDVELQKSAQWFSSQHFCEITGQVSPQLSAPGVCQGRLSSQDGGVEECALISAIVFCEV